MDDEDLRYFWAAYKSGGLSHADPVFSTEMNVPDFKAQFSEYVSSRFNGAWTFVSDESGTTKPMGFALGVVRDGRLIQLEEMIWLPWASPREVLEAATGFMDSMRRNEVGGRPVVVLEYSRMKDKKFFEAIAKRGVMRRVGHVHDIYRDEPAVLFQTRAVVEE